MSYVERNLTPGENVVYQTRLHWVTFLAPAILTGVFLLLAIVAALGGEEGSGAVGALFFMLFLPLVGLIFLSRFITWKTSEFAVTNQRLIVKIGWIRRKTLELLLKKVEAVAVDQGIVGRILDYGTVTVSGTGGAHSPFVKVAQPLILRNKVNGLLDSTS